MFNLRKNFAVHILIMLMIPAVFAYQAEHIRRYEQAATEYLLAEGGVSLPAGKSTNKG